MKTVLLCMVFVCFSSSEKITREPIEHAQVYPMAGLTRCQIEEQNSVNNPDKPGVRRVMCDDDGNYMPHQVDRENNLFYCVDHNGKQIGEKTREPQPCKDYTIRTKCQLEKKDAKSEFPRPDTRKNIFCDKRGYYQPLQKSNGQYYCVDLDGIQVDHSSFVKLICKDYRPLSKCLQEQIDGKNKKPGARKQVWCDDQGFYQPTQIDFDTQRFYCVDTEGNQIGESSATMLHCEETFGTPKPAEETTTEKTTTPKPTEPTVKTTTPKPTTTTVFKKCLHDRQVALDKYEHGITTIFIPVCDKHGDFKELQFHNATGFFFCVNKFSGDRWSLLYIEAIDCSTVSTPVISTTTKFTESTTLRPTTPKEKTKCQKDFDDAIAKEQNGETIYLPRCDKNGDYVPLQGLCTSVTYWCGDPEGNRISEFHRHRMNCDKYFTTTTTEEPTTTTTTEPTTTIPTTTIEPYKKCPDAREEAIEKLKHNHKNVILWDCDEEDNYRALQKHLGLKMYFCADKITGKRLTEHTKHKQDCSAIFVTTTTTKEPTTVTTESTTVTTESTTVTTQPTTTTTKKARGDCEDYKGVEDNFEPDCDEDGFFKPLQCITKPGNRKCWCADKTGNPLTEPSTIEPVC